MTFAIIYKSVGLTASEVIFTDGSEVYPAEYYAGQGTEIKAGYINIQIDKYI